ncbi:MAG: diaminopimelate decarboxylase, partial [Ignavibacteria bacterium]
DYLAVMSAGAYGSVMSSNYNGRRKAAEILIDNHEAYLIKKRESFEDLIRGEQIPKESLEL